MSETEPRLFELSDNKELFLQPLLEIDFRDLPRPVIDHLDFENSRLELPKHPALVQNPRVLDFGQHGRSYLVGYSAERLIGGPLKFELIHELDVAADQSVQGGGTSILRISEDGEPEEENPYVEYTFTNDAHQRRGLALRRLLILDRANQLFFGRRLASGSFTAPAAEPMWQQLEHLGLAEQFESSHYRFI